MPGHPYLVFVALLFAAGCAHGEGELYGSYEAHDMGLNDFTPPVTLSLQRSHRYRFCVGQTCSVGRWSVQRQDQSHGRLTLVGAPLEKWMRDFNIAAAHSEDPRWLDILDGSVETDYDIVFGSTSITLGSGDAAFVKR